MVGGVEGPDRIFVGGLPYYFTEVQIRELLESFGYGHHSAIYSFQTFFFIYLSLCNRFVFAMRLMYDLQF